jgi:hypothetical protein
LELVGLNLFKNRSTDATVVKRQIITTRLFLFLLTGCLLVLLSYTSLSVQERTETLQKPIFAVYSTLQKNYPNSLQCPCTQLMIPYGTFVQNKPVFHQVCSSDFVSQSWIDFIFATNVSFIWSLDVRTSLSSMWQLVASLCQSATNTIFDELNQFANDLLITSEVISEEILQATTQTALENVR